MPDTTNVTRVEVIDHSDFGMGRAYVRWDEQIKVELSLQDDGRTLKIFISDRNEDPTPG